MKIIKTGFFTICLILINVYNAFAQDPEPPFPPEQPPGGRVPIDDHILFLIIAGVILGVTLIYRNKLKKASV